jgi:hypothetical protein
MALTTLRYNRNPEEIVEAILEFEEEVFKVQRIVTLILNWCFLPFIILCLVITSWTAMIILTIIWVSLVLLWWVGVQIYKTGVMQDWWDEF